MKHTFSFCLALLTGLLLASSLFTGSVNGQGFPFWPTGRIDILERLGANCGPALYDPNLDCDFPVGMAWPRINTTNSGYVSGGPVYVLIQAMKPIYPFLDPDVIGVAGNWVPEWFGETIATQMAKIPQYPAAITFPVPDCGGELRFVTEAKPNQNIAFGSNIYADPSSNVYNSVFLTQPEPTPQICVDNIRFAFNYLPICGTNPATIGTMNCYQGAPGAPGGCAQNMYAPDVFTPSYATFTWNGTGFPPAAEYPALGSYYNTSMCTYWGTNWEALSGVDWTSRGQGFIEDAGAPGPFIGIVSVLINLDAGACTAAETVPPGKPFQLEWTGLYNQLSFAPVRVDTTLQDPPNSNWSAPYDNRIFNLPQPSCARQFTRPSTSPRLSEENLSLYAPVCRMMLPYSPSYNLEQYLNATGGIIQPQMNGDRLARGDVVSSVAVSNLPSNGYVLNVDITAQSACNFLTGGILACPDVTGDFVPVFTQWMKNGEYFFFTQPSAPAFLAASEGVYYRRNTRARVFAVWNYMNEPFTTQWVPPCACNTTATDFSQSNVICDTDYQLIQNRPLMNPDFQPGQFTTYPSCTIETAPGESWYGSVRGQILQNTDYALLVNLQNSTSTIGFAYQWYVIDTKGNQIFFSDPVSSSSYVRVQGENATNIGVSVTSLQSGLSGQCQIQLAVFRGCPVASLISSNSSVAQNLTIILDASATEPPAVGVPLSYEWSILGTWPPGLESSASFQYLDRIATPFSASSLGLYAILLKVTALRDSSQGGSCTSTLTTRVLVYNATTGITPIGNPDTPLVPQSCFDDQTYNGTLPYNRPFPDPVPQFELPFQQPIGGFSGSSDYTTNSVVWVADLFRKAVQKAERDPAKQFRNYLKEKNRMNATPSSEIPDASPTAILIVSIVIAVLIGLLIGIATLSRIQWFQRRSPTIRWLRQNCGCNCGRSPPKLDLGEEDEEPLLPSSIEKTRDERPAAPARKRRPP